MPKTGAIWLSPAGLGKEIAITAPIPQTMHLYLPTALFDRLKDDSIFPSHRPIRSAMPPGSATMSLIRLDVQSSPSLQPGRPQAACKSKPPL
jgi:hypothetical protein